MRKDAADELREGMRHLIPLEFLRMFTTSEFQSLLGHRAVGLDVDDLRHHTTVQSAEFGAQLQWFWSILADMTDIEQQQFLRFLISSPFPPSGGFRSLKPMFNIILASGSDDHLPSVSTCAHSLFLPQYSSKEIMREKLLYALRNAEGFHLA